MDKTPYQEFEQFCKSSRGSVFNYILKIRNKNRKANVYFIVSKEQAGEKFFLPSIENISVLHLIPKFEKHKKTLGVGWDELSILAYSINNKLPGLWVHGIVMVSETPETITFSSSRDSYESSISKAITYQNCLEAVKEAFDYLRTTPEQDVAFEFPANEYFEELLPINRRSKKFISLEDYK